MRTVTSDEGREIRERRMRYGWTQAEVAAEAGVNRDTVAAVEVGTASDASRNKVLRAIEALEEEAGIGAPPAVENGPGELMEIRAEGVYGIQSIVVNGPVRDRDELVETIARLIERVRREEK